MNKLLSASAIFAFLLTPVFSTTTKWITDTQEEWEANSANKKGLNISDGMAAPTGESATYASTFKSFDKKQKPVSIKIGQSPVWQNWNPIENLGPENLGDAPVFLQIGPKNYWMFGRYKAPATREGGGKEASLEGFDIPLKTTPLKNVFNAEGGLKGSQGGYNAWQSRDMKNWVHHGPVGKKHAQWMTTAEFADGKAYLYYDFPNDQDPHLYVDGDLTDGMPGEDMGLVFKDPSHGSDCAIIRSLDGKFHLISEDWSPIDASTHAWDSPLASHAVSADGLGNFELQAPPVDERTKPTGEKGVFNHPHWVKEDPKNFKTSKAEYDIHEPAQNAYGDWAAICIGGQYYLFADFDPASEHGKKPMSVAWFTSDDINKQFTFCDHIGKGHPDPDIIFAEGQFYLATQMKTDYCSPGPWVESVEVRVGVDTDNDKKVDHWSDWAPVKERYDYIKGFSKQVAKTPAELDLANLPEGYGFCYEVKVTDTTENKSKPILDKVELTVSEVL